MAEGQPDTAPAPIASPAPAATANPSDSTQATGQTAAPQTVADDDPLICRNEIVTGSNFSQRVCERRSVREARRKADQSTLGNAQAHSGMVQGH